MKKANKNFARSEKFLAGCEAVSGKPVVEISGKAGMSREYVYQQKAKVLQYANALDSAVEEAPMLRLDEKTIKRMILSLTLDCQAPNSGIVRFFETVIGERVSAGYISGVIAQAAKAAQAFDDQIDLSGISQGAHDEIFQCGIPVLVGLDPESTYTYLLEEASDRSGQTWAACLEDRKEHGLDLNVSINDSGRGLMSGIPQAFPDVEIQADTFHAVYDLGKEVSKLERKANKQIKEEYALLDNLCSKRPRAKSKAALEETRSKAANAIELYDNIFILFVWLKELLNFSGYSLSQTLMLAQWVLQELDVLATGNSNLLAQTAKIRKMLPSLLSFIGRLERQMEAVAKETQIPLEGLRLMYQQLSCGCESPKSNELLYRQTQILGERYPQARSEFERLLKQTKKASSLAENLNGRIRVFVEVKRVIPASFFILLKVYFNTRRYPRSRLKERIAKSPLELMTKIPQPDFLEAIGY